MSEEASADAVVSAGVAEQVSGQTGQTAEQAPWTAGFKDAELAKHPSAAKFKDTESVFKSYVEAEKRLGGMVSIPKEGDTEGWKKFYGKLGVPDSPDKYEFEEREFQGIKLGKNEYQDYAKVAHEIGLTPAQVKRLAEFDFQRQTSAYERVQKQIKEAETARSEAIKKTFAENHESMTAKVKQNIEKFADDESRAILMSRVEKDPEMFKLIANMSSQFSEDSIPQNPAKDSEADASTEYQAMLMDMNHPLNIATHPEHKKAVEKHNRLFNLIHKSK